MKVAYYYRQAISETPEGAAKHKLVLSLLSRLRADDRITEYVTQEAEAAFPTKEAQETLFKQLRDFATRHKVALAHPFGSRRYGFCYLPAQFMLVSDGDSLREVFPCRIGDEEIDPSEYLERLASGQPWTTHLSPGMEGKKHAALITQILDNPGVLEQGLVLRSRSVQVSRDFGEVGYVDLVFQDREGRFLLVEVKVRPDELDKAVGQILRYRQLFAQQNQIQQSSIRLGIACPYIPPQYRSICESGGIACFEISLREPS